MKSQAKVPMSWNTYYLLSGYLQEEQEKLENMGREDTQHYKQLKEAQQELDELRRL